MKNLGFLALSLLWLLEGCSGDGSDTATSALTGEALGGATSGADGQTDSLVANVPDGAVSAVVACTGLGPDHIGSLYALSTPGGSVAYDYENPKATPFRASVVDDTIPFLIPVSPDLDIEAGAWPFTLTFDASGLSADCNAVYRTDAPGSASAVNVDVYLVGVAGITASNAADDQSLNDTFDALGQIWGSAGVGLGAIRYFDVSDTDTYAVLDMSDDADPEVDALFASAEPSDPRTLSLFLVQEINDSSGGTVFGVSGGPPGAAGIPGNSQSAIAVGTADLATDPEFTAKVIAHEMGHFMGLFHTTEKDFSSTDPLSDTPECTDTDGNGTASSEECPDGGYLMFWSAKSVTVSDDQGWVLSRSPAAH
jgi:hypothetical protein